MSGEGREELDARAFEVDGDGQTTAQIYPACFTFLSWRREWQTDESGLDDVARFDTGMEVALHTAGGRGVRATVRNATAFDFGDGSQRHSFCGDMVLNLAVIVAAGASADGAADGLYQQPRDDWSVMVRGRVLLYDAQNRCLYLSTPWGVTQCHVGSKLSVCRYEQPSDAESDPGYRSVRTLSAEDLAPGTHVTVEGWPWVYVSHDSLDKPWLRVVDSQSIDHMHGAEPDQH
jgi:hypothetical protein